MTAESAGIDSEGINYCRHVSISADGNHVDPFPLDATTIKIDGLREAIIDAETLVLDRSLARCHVLNASSSAIWQFMGGDLTIGGMIEDVTSETDLDREEIIPIVTAAIRGFADAGLIKVIDRTAEPVDHRDSEPDSSSRENAQDRNASAEGELGAAQIARGIRWRRIVSSTLDRIPGLTVHGPWQFGDVRATIATDNAAVGAYLEHILLGLRVDGSEQEERATVRIHIVRRRSEGQELVSSYFDGQPAARRSSPADSIEVTLQELNLLATTRTSGAVLLHAGAVEFDGRVVVVTGESGRGKSTLTAALVQAGGGYLTDELVIIDPEDLNVRPYPKPLDLDPNSLELLGLPPDDGFVVAKRHVSPTELGAISLGGRLAGVLILGPDPTTIAEFDPAQGVTELLPNVFAATHDSPRSMEMLAKISTSVPIFALPRSTPGDFVGSVKEQLGFTDSGNRS